MYIRDLGAQQLVTPLVRLHGKAVGIGLLRQMISCAGRIDILIGITPEALTLGPKRLAGPVVFGAVFAVAKFDLLKNLGFVCGFWCGFCCCKI